MTSDLAPVSDYITQISASDILSEGVDPAGFYKSLLDGVNSLASFYGWRGVSFQQVGYSKTTGVFSLTVGRGAAPATLHLMRRHIAETTKGGQADNA